MKMVLLRVVMGVGWLIAGCAAIAAADSPGDPAAGQQKSLTCVACHGPNGQGFNPIWPKLAGQSTHYIIKQLRDFQAKRRVNDIMEPMIAALTEPDIADLAAFFSSQAVTGGEAGDVAKGKNIYLKGRIGDRVLACTGCHGIDGSGNADRFAEYAAPPNLMAPALAGQYATYVAAQLRAFRAGERTNDVGGIMRDIAEGMSDDDIDAVAQYIEALP